MRYYFNSSTKLTAALLCLGLLALVPLSALDFVPGSGADISAGFNSERDRDFYYHHNTDDQHWYGTNKWAVRFDFGAEYPTYASSEFVINKARIYFPVIPSTATPVTIGIYSEANNYPNTLLSSVTADLTSHWMEFVLPAPITAGVAWLVLTCNTAPNGPYVSASLGGGTHSYYWNTNSPVEYFQNLAVAGIYSEFLFSVTGRFELSNADLELSAFELGPEIRPRQILHPQFTVINNSSQVITHGKIILTITGANPGFAVQDTILISRELAPYAELNVAFDEPDYQEYFYPLPEYPTQFKVKAELTSELAAADTLFNNSITHYYDSFSHDLPARLVENFLSYAQSANLLAAQDPLAVEGIAVLNYFPVVADTFYAAGAVQRFNWYGLNGLPMTVAGGDALIAGYVPSAYPQQYGAALEELAQQQTYLQQNSVSLNLPSPYSTIAVRLNLRNSDTYVFNNGIDPTLAYQVRFFAALCRKVELHGAHRYIFDRWSAYADTVGSALALGESWLKQFNVPVGNIGLDSLFTDYELVYWLQHNTTRQVIFANTIPLNDIVANADNTVPDLPMLLTLSPNPVRTGQILKLATVKQSSGTLDFAVYSVRGQRVQKGSSLWNKGEATLKLDGEYAAGLYLIKLSFRDKTQPEQAITTTKKLLIYK
jgi:hypothetical protein